MTFKGKKNYFKVQKFFCNGIGKRDAIKNNKEKTWSIASNLRKSAL
jgi:hypothetical protein